MAEKKVLRIMVVDRKFGPLEEQGISFFNQCNALGYDMVIFPFREDNRRTEVIYFDFTLTEALQELFCVDFETDYPGFCDFDLDEVEEQTFYDILNQQFIVLPFFLTNGLVDVHHVQSEKDNP